MKNEKKCFKRTTNKMLATIQEKENFMIIRDWIYQ